MKTYTFKGKKVFLKKEEYRNNGTLAVLMYTEDGELYDCITVNLNNPLQSDSLAFLDENNLPGIGRWITKHKLGIDMGFNACSGFCTYPLYMLL
jgi:hypothetical protein